ncbi:MAG: hypothetical protein FWB82_03745 [Treponema sp.]|nr:hypothetical protein [Treponema sp.]MCL2205615.1 hypothetical protein [Treponema sp.]
MSELCKVPDWRTVKYQSVFENALSGLHRRTESDSECTVQDIEKVLKQMYIRDGADGGRGELQDIIMAANIAAHEYYIAQWKAQARRE